MGTRLREPGLARHRSFFTLHKYRVAGEELLSCDVVLVKKILDGMDVEVFPRAPVSPGTMGKTSQPIQDWDSRPLKRSEAQLVIIVHS